MSIYYITEYTISSLVLHGKGNEKLHLGTVCHIQC